MITGGVFALMVLVHMGTTQETVADPFGGQGHWVSTGDDGGEECMMHWWRNDCKVGSKRGGGDETIV
jgi:hypothetical protein